MAPQRSTRSTRSTRQVARSIAQSGKQRISHSRKNSNKVRVTRPTTRSNPGAAPSVESDSAALHDGEDSKEQSDENDDGPSSGDQADVIAPSRGFQANTTAVAKLVEQSLPENTSEPWTGLKSKSDRNENMNVDEVDRASEAGSDSSGVPEPDSDIDDDDNYDDVDQISNASDSSEAFEREVENEILAAGEDAIDWNDENTYNFDESFHAGQYSAAVELDLVASPVFEEDIFGLGSRLAAARVSDDQPPKRVLFDSELDRRVPGSFTYSAGSSKWGGSESGDSSGASRRSSVTQDRSQTTSQSFDAADEDLTDDEEPRNSTIASPGVTLSRSSTRLSKVSVSTRIITEETPRKGAAMPMRRKIPIDCSKVVAFTAGSIYGRRFRVKRRHNHYFKWVQICTSPCSTTPNSPTMIDLQSALGQGNTRTGAGITDAIHGRLFQQFHCGHDSYSVIDNTILASEFAKMPHLRAFRRQPYLGHSSVFGPMQDFALMQDSDSQQDEALAFIDFGSCLDDDDEDDEDMQDGVMVKTEVHDDDVMDANPSVPLIVGPSHSRSASGQSSNIVTSCEQPLDTPPTPTSPDKEFLLPIGVSSSPKKRRASNLSGRRSVSPAMKRQRADFPNEVAV